MVSPLEQVTAISDVVPSIDIEVTQKNSASPEKKRRLWAAPRPGDWRTIRRPHVNTTGPSGATHAAPSGRGLALLDDTVLEDVNQLHAARVPQTRKY